jgi:glycolate oxidase FAD binding subunit
VNAFDNEALRPASEDEAAQMVREARASKRRIDIVGGGTRSGLGRPRRGEARLTTSALSGVVFYEPAEMVVCAQAGTPLSVVEAALGKAGQMLPFEPMDHRTLYATRGEPTIGGLVAGNVSGPRRISAGAARDSLLGVRLVNGEGEIVKDGGRVMKNVTGLDLVKLNCGAHGTLGLLTQATLKLLPRPETEATIVIRRLDDPAAIDAMTKALGSPYLVSGAAHVSAGMGREFPRTFLRLEGLRESVDYRVARLIELLAPFGAKHALEPGDSAKIWRAIRDAEFLAEPRDHAVWRVSVAPSRGAAFVAGLGAVALNHFYDWGGGLVWLSSAPDSAAAIAIRKALAPFGGHATLMRAPDELRAAVDVFEPLSAPLMRITRGLKESFDPDGILNSGRMYRNL